MRAGLEPAVLTVLMYSVYSLCSPCSRVMVQEEGLGGMHSEAGRAVRPPTKTIRKIL